jgi:hypothetical protein
MATNRRPPTTALTEREKAGTRDLAVTNPVEQTTPSLADYGFPEPTPENRAKVGCYAWPPADYSGCWCGYHCVDGYGCCPECAKLARGFENVEA